MTDSDALRKELHHLLNTQQLAVLATQNAGQPYTSLVSFAPASDLKELLFATTRSTRKYANLTADPRAAMLVDNRSNNPSDIHAAMGLTATGIVAEVPDRERDVSLARYLEKHPHLTDFANSPSCALLRLTIRTYYLVRRFQHVVEIHMPS
jgi:nitroimidazol reductase NimA-like FMN-containing flavoprotein (pyridoxamine 5'-phosphate oxidase superfamily)